MREVFELVPVTLEGERPFYRECRRFVATPQEAVEATLQELETIPPARKDVVMLLGRPSIREGYRTEGIWISNGQRWERRI